MVEMVLIRFIKHRAPYQASETAAFTAARAKQFVDAGFAEYVKKKGRPKAKLAVEPVVEKNADGEETAEGTDDGEETTEETEEDAENGEESEETT